MHRKIPQLDSVRGVAILLVLGHNLHGFSSFLISYFSLYGWMGVDLFFVLSGFLITGILLDSKASESYFRNFYARRCLRIWPLYYSLLVVMFLVIPRFQPQVGAEIFRRSCPWWSYLFFLQNFLVRDPAANIGSLGVTWSLAVEELFYLVWPLFVRFLPQRLLEMTALVVCVLSPILRLFVVSHGWLIYSNPFCRLDGLMAGGLLAMLVRKTGFLPGRFLPAAWLGLLFGAPMAVVSEMHSQRWLTFSLAALASAGLLYVAQFSQWSWVRAIFTNRFLMFSGTISYGLYLLHKLPQNALKLWGLGLSHPQAVFWTSVVAAYLLAAASWFLFEKPILRLKRFFEMQSSSPGGDSPALPQLNEPNAADL